jgi:acyl-CoA thioesterase
MTTLFDEDTRLERTGDNRFHARISDRWNVGPVPNGGYLLSIAARALGVSFDDREPRALTVHFLRPSKPGPLVIDVEKVKEGRRFATGVAKLTQNDREIARVLATFAAPGPGAGPRLIAATPPELPPIETCKHVVAPEGIAIARRFESRYDPATGGFFDGVPSGKAEIRAWIRFDDGREPDVWSMPLICDALPPPLLNVAFFPWIPTLELTVHVRARPAPGWLRTSFVSRFIFDGLLETDGEVWDSEGKLVAQSRQLMTAGAES